MMSLFRLGIASLTFSFLIVLPFSSEGQKLTTKRLIALGEEHYKSQQYFKAAKFFKQALSGDKGNALVIYKLADSYRNSYNYKQAEFYFNKYKSTGDEEFPQNEFYLALSKKLNNKYDEAIKGFDTFLNQSESFEDKALFLEQARVEKEGCLLAIERQNLPFIESNFRLLDVPTNSKYNDYAPYIYANDSSLIFTSSRKEAKGNLQDNRFGESFTDLFRYQFNGTGWKKSDNKDNFDVINTTFNEGAGSLSRDGNKNYFTRCEGPKCEIYVSQKVNGKWKEAVKLNENINQSKSESKHPSIAPDGNTLFFVSNRSGGKGMNDIWMSTKSSDEDWGEALNLSDVNTAFNEGAPFYSDSLDILTFSSAGHPGYGGLDIFVLKGFNSGSSKVENMGKPYNSNFDDIYFTFGSEKGYLSSNRSNGKGGFDIYGFDIFSSFFDFEKLREKQTEASGINEGDVSISGDISFGGKAQSNHLVYLLDENGEVIDSTYSDSQGKFSFQHLKEDANYSFRLDESDSNSTISLSFVDQDGNVVKDISSDSDPRSFKFENLSESGSNTLARRSGNDVSISGSMTFGGGAKAGQTVYLVDENGRVVDSTVTDDEGNFKFDHLDENVSYSFKMDESNADASVSLSFISKNGEVINEINSDSDARSFQFESLDQSSSELTRQGGNDISLSGSISFLGEQMANKEVILVNEAGQEVGRTFTDENGKFNFSNLDENENYSFKLKETDDQANISLAFRNGSGEVINEMNSDSDARSFQFENLDQSTSELARQGDKDVSLSGSISFLGEQMANKEVILVNEAGQEVGRTFTDENGKFNFSNLDENENYSFKLNETDEQANISLAFISGSGEVLKEIDSERDKRYFDFQSIDEKSSTATRSSNNDSGMSFDLFRSKLTREVDENEYKELEKTLTKEDKARIVYRVQVGAFNNPPSDSYFESLNDLGKIERKNEGGLVKFLMGSVRNLSIAEILRNEVYDRGIRDVFIGVYYQNERIAILMYN